MRIFVALGDLWGLSETERRLVLGFPSRATYYLWCKRARERASLTLSLDVLCRISAVLSIQQALEIQFPGEETIDWINENNAALTGRSPLALITSGLYQDLFSVYRFINAELGDRPVPPNRIAEALSMK
jgi:hypothetical protein